MPVTEYYALYPLGETEIDYCRDLGRFVDDLPEIYDKEKDEWVYDVDLLDIFTGDLEAEEITEKQMEYIMKRIKSGEAEELARETWLKECRAGKYEAYGIPKDKY